MFLFNIGKLNIYTWGTMVNIGFLVALLVAYLESKRKKIFFGDIFILAVIIYMSAILGSWLANFLVNKSIDGFMFIGGAVMSFISSFVYIEVQKNTLNFWQLADIIIVALPFGMFFGRIGCFLVNDHIGSITNLPWRVQMYNHLRHPIIIYLLVNITILIVLLNWLKFKIIKAGLLFLIGGIYYSVSRFFLDFFRCYDLWGCDLRFYSLTVTQLILIPIFMLFVVFFIKRWYSKRITKCFE